MAHKRKRGKRGKRVGEISTTALVIGGVAVVGLALLVMNMNKPAATTIIKPAPSNSAATTAAEIAAGASVVNTLVNDLTPDEEDS